MSCRLGLTGGGLKFGRPLKVCLDLRNRCSPHSNRMPPMYNIFFSTLEYSENVSGPQIGQPTNPLTCCPAIRPYAGKTLTVNKSVALNLKFRCPIGLYMFTAEMPSQSLINSSTNGFRNTSMVSEVGAFSPGINIVNVMKNFLETNQGGGCR